MAREGKAFSKEKKSSTLGPSPNSKRSVKRSNRGFKSLEVSSRKHKRAERRSNEVRTISGKILPPGTKAVPDLGAAKKTKAFLHTAGGSLKFH